MEDEEEVEVVRLEDTAARAADQASSSEVVWVEAVSGLSVTGTAEEEGVVEEAGTKPEDIIVGEGKYGNCRKSVIRNITHLRALLVYLHSLTNNSNRPPP